MPQPLRVLIVDDYPDSAEAIAQLLSLHGYDARDAQSSAAAIQAVTTGFAPDVVILDLRLPDGD